MHGMVQFTNTLKQDGYTQRTYAAGTSTIPDADDEFVHTFLVKMVRKLFVINELLH